jgi:hypothetical protein
MIFYHVLYKFHELILFKPYLVTHTGDENSSRFKIIKCFRHHLFSRHMLLVRKLLQTELHYTYLSYYRYDDHE